MTKRNQQVGITGTGSYVPDQVVTNEDMMKIVDTSDEWIVSRSGIRERRKIDPADATSDMATRAARKAILKAGIQPDDLDLIIVGTATPDTLFPSTACIVQNNLKAGKAAAFDLSAGCTGFIYSLTVGAQFIAAGLYKNVLVIGADALTRVTNYTDRNTCVLFGDGAGAVVLQAVKEDEGFLAFDLGADGSGGDVLCMPAGGSRKPASYETVDQHGHQIYMNGKEVFKFAVKVLGETAVKSMKEAGLTIEDIDKLVPHQANLRIIESAVKRLGIQSDKVAVNIDRYGNMSNACIPVAIDEEYRAGRIKKGDNVLLISFGAGLTWGSCIIKWSI